MSILSRAIGRGTLSRCSSLSSLTSRSSNVIRSVFPALASQQVRHSSQWTTDLPWMPEGETEVYFGPYLNIAWEGVPHLEEWRKKNDDKFWMLSAKERQEWIDAHRRYSGQSPNPPGQEYGLHYCHFGYGRNKKLTGPTWFHILLERKYNLWYEPPIYWFYVYGKVYNPRWVCILTILSYLCYYYLWCREEIAWKEAHDLKWFFDRAPPEFQRGINWERKRCVNAG